MKPRTLIELLELEHPEQEVVLYSQSKRVMQILGINAAKSAELGAIVLDVDWSVTEGRVVETEKDKLIRQRDKLTREIGKLTEAEKRKLAAKVRHKSKSNRSKTAQMIDDIIGPMKTGRPKKTPKKRGRPRKYKTKEELAQEKDE